MTDAQKLAVKKFLHSVKGAVMAMDVETLKDAQLAMVFNDFVALVDSDLPILGEVAAWSDITGKPAVIAAGSTAAEALAVIDDAAIGTTATTAAAGNHDHAIVENTASGLAAAANIQELAIALSARIKALEDAP